MKFPENNHGIKPIVTKNIFNDIMNLVIDNASGLADKSNKFSNFLTVSRKLGYTCLYIFHLIYPTKSIW